MLDVKIKKLTPEAVIPFYATDGSAGMDLTAISYEYDYENDCHIYGTGLAFEIPEGHVGLIFPRSSNRETDSYYPNSVGVIDSDYRKEVYVTFKNRDESDRTTPQSVGNRVGQMIIIPYPKINFIEVEELSKTNRTGGHGSTGK